MDSYKGDLKKLQQVTEEALAGVGLAPPLTLPSAETGIPSTSAGDMPRFDTYGPSSGKPTHDGPPQSVQIRSDRALQQHEVAPQRSPPRRSPRHNPQNKRARTDSSKGKGKEKVSNVPPPPRSDKPVISKQTTGGSHTRSREPEANSSLGRVCGKFERDIGLIIREAVPPRLRDKADRSDGKELVELGRNSIVAVILLRFSLIIISLLR